MTLTRADALKRLRTLGYPVGVMEMAVIMDVPVGQARDALVALYSRDLVDRFPCPKRLNRYLYVAKELNS